MNDVAIGRLSATVSSWPDGQAARVPAMLRRLADARLEQALDAASLPEGEWCLRRVDVDVELDPTRPTAALETDWAEQIVIAIRRSLRTGHEDVVRYDRPEDALDDLVAGLVRGRSERAWAWRQVGLLGDTDPEPEADPRGLLLQVLARRRALAGGAVTRLLRAVGAAPVHRLLGARGWAALADIVAGPSRRPVPLTAPGPDEARPTTAEERTRLAAVARAHRDRSAGAAILRASGLRVDAATRLSWARIVLAEVAPALLAGAEGEALVPVLADLLRPETAAGLGTVATRTHHSERFTDRPSEGPRDDAPAAAPPPGHGTEGDQAAVGDDVVAPSAAARGAAATAWGGLLFLLNTADAAGLPGRLAAEEALSARPLSWSVQRLGTRLVPALLDDPAVLALAGVDPDLPAPADPAPTWAEDAALDAAAAVWAAVTVALVDGPVERTAAETADRVRAIAARPATVRREPGWVEVELPLETVDLDVRRAGLDLDPGWVWWLGQVVRFGYG